MRSDETAVSVTGLTKAYRLFDHPGDRIKQFFSLGLRRYHREFVALRDVSFSVRRGEKVGIIGRNGSGKSTLLQVVCGILKPTAGMLNVNGSVSALLELGAGFNPEFTGRENVYFQGLLTGLGKAEMDDRFDEIAAFADIGEFIDQPVRTYSSGMFVRLAFSVAVSIDPEILIVDEALGVGDAAFQHKSRRRMQELTDDGTTLLVVSHDRSMVSALCDRCILLHEGALLLDDAPPRVFDYYYALLAQDRGDSDKVTRLDAGETQVVSGTGEARVEKIRLLQKDGQELSSIDVGADVVLEFDVGVYHPIPRLVLGFSIRDQYGHLIFGTNTNSFEMSLVEVKPGQRYMFRFEFQASIGPGSYSISTALVSSNDRFTNNYECRDMAFLFEVQNRGHVSFGGSAWLDPSLTVSSS